MRRAVVLTLAAALGCVASTLRADEVRYPEPPGERVFVRDEAELIAAPHVTVIQEVCAAVLDERRVPILVVTLPSLAAYGASGWSIERYAQGLFDEWGIGYPGWNHGMLLLVSRDDRQARIELGGAWKFEPGRQALRIMDETLLPSFRQGKYSEGIRAGVHALADVAREIAPPVPLQHPPSRGEGEAETPWYDHPLGWGIGLLVAGSLLSLADRGRQGWGYKAWAALFTVLGVILLIAALARRFGGRRGGGSGGGSVGGGSSGSGGASGSW